MRASTLVAAVAVSLSTAACFPDDPRVDDLKGDDPTPSAPAPQNFGTWMSADVAPDGARIAMSFYDREYKAVGFAVGTPHDDGTVTWAFEQVDGYPDPNTGLASPRGEYTSMKVAPDGTVWVSYYDAQVRKLKAAHRTGGGPATGTPASWVTMIVDDSPGTGTWTSLDIDVNGAPVIAYHDEENGTLKVATPVDLNASVDTFAWTIETVWQGQPFSGTDADGGIITREADVGEHARLLIEGGNQMIAFYDKAQQRLALTERTSGGAWNTPEFVSPEGSNMGQWPSMLIDSGTLYIAYHNLTDQDLMVSSRSPSGWVTVSADTSDFVGADTEIFRRNGKISVLYFDGQNNDMKLATQLGAAWSTETVGGEDEPVGFHNEVVRIGEQFWAMSYDFKTQQAFVKALPVGG
ncbi:MAG: hypothetical protein H6733_08255 [Alphaproteobacteria bacterium]|nr:hypothetical protein [Alphaproteobacteria bacterium]